MQAAIQPKSNYHDTLVPPQHKTNSAKIGRVMRTVTKLPE